MDINETAGLDLLVITQQDSVAENLRSAVAQAEDEKINLFQAASIEEALKLIYQKPFDMAMLELGPVGSGDLARFAWFVLQVPFLPIITLVSEKWTQLGRDSLLGGAHDWLPIETLYPDMVLRSIRYAREAHRMKEALRGMSLIDNLTGLYNKTGLSAVTAPLIHTLKRARKPALLLSVDLLDMDEIMETLGQHEQQNAVILASQVLWKSFRASDVLARTAPFEFAVYAPGAVAKNSDAMIERVKKKLRTQKDSERWPFMFRLKIGYIELSASTDLAVDELIRKARILSS